MTSVLTTHLARERSTHARNLAAMVLASGRVHTGPAIRARSGDGFLEWSHATFLRKVSDLARGLIASGVEPGDRIAVLSSTRPEWTLADCAALVAGAVVVPIYHTNSAQECAYVLADAGVRLVVAEDAEQVAKLAAVGAELPGLRQIVTMQPVAGEASLDDLMAMGAAIPEADVFTRADAVAPGDVATIVYTSGTTGPPKGCVITHRNLSETLRMYEDRLELDGDAVVFLFLPLAHVLARVTQFVTLDVGGTLAFWSGDPATVLDDLAALHPTHVPAVPRVFEKVRTRALSTVEDGNLLKRRLFHWSLDIGGRVRAAERAGEVGRGLAMRHALADRLVLSKVRGLFGDRLQMALTGAAPIAADVLEFFDACGVLVLEGYGLSESCAAATLNTVDEHRFGTVGRALPGVEVAIAGDGEILLRGPSIFRGYHGRPHDTAEVLDGGWLSTGDLGEVDADGYLRITGRKKDLIITSSGKNVAPANVEAALRESRWISQAVVAGDNRPYLVALFTLDPEEAPVLAADLGVPADLTTMARDEQVLAVIRSEVDRANQRFARIEQVKRFAVLDHDLTQEADELTPTLKVKRRLVTDRYADAIAALYDAP